MAIELAEAPLALDQPAAVRRSTLTGEVEVALRTDIIVGVWSPGERIKAAEVTQRYGVSATPAREALQRLAAQGLVVLDTQRSARVAPVSIQDLRDAYEIRIMLEPEALRRSIRNGGPEWKERLLAAWQTLQTVQVPAVDRWREEREKVLRWAEAHRTFHLTLASACGSELLVRVITTMYNHCERYRLIARRLTSASDAMHGNGVILEAALAGNVDEAAELLRTHLQESLEVVLADEARRGVVPSPA